MDRTQFGLGFVANAPDVMTGAGAYAILPIRGGIGVYVDAKFDRTNPSSNLGFEDGITADQVQAEVVGNEFIKDESSWKSFNAALVRPLSPFLVVYAGGGLAKRKVFELYEEPLGTLGVAGVFWVEAPAREETQVNLIVGAFLRLTSRISTQFGFETQPFGVTVGVSARLPRW